MSPVNRISLRVCDLAFRYHADPDAAQAAAERLADRRHLVVKVEL
jgi:hypothetical protein